MTYLEKKLLQQLDEENILLRKLVELLKERVQLVTEELKALKDKENGNREQVNTPS